MKVYVDDDIIRGQASFERYEDKAIMAFLSKPGITSVPKGKVYTINGENWIVTDSKKSNFNSNVINLYLDIALP